MLGWGNPGGYVFQKAYLEFFTRCHLDAISHQNGVHVNFSFSSEENVLALLQVLGRWPGVNFQVVKNIMIILIIKITLIMIIIIIMTIIIIMIMIIMITGCKQQWADQLHQHPVWEADCSHLGSFPRPGDRSGPVETEKRNDDRHK